jgi:altronate dehydratase
MALADLRAGDEIQIAGEADAPVTALARMSGDMDVNAGRIITGEATVAEIGREILDHVIAVAGGAPTKSEALGHREYCIPYKHQDMCVNA